MIVSDFVPAVFLAATGKVATFTTGSTKWLKILALANIELDNFQDEPDVDWNDLYSPKTSFGVVTATDNFTFPATVRKLSSQEGNPVRILHTDGVAFTDYDIIDFERQKDYANGQATFQDNYVIENNGKIYFNRAFTSADPQFGGIIQVPTFGFITHIVADADTIPVPIPNYLVFATAAAYDSTDVTRQNLVPRLEARANKHMQTMKRNNKGQLTKIFSQWNPTGNMNMESEAFA